MPEVVIADPAYYDFDDFNFNDGLVDFISGYGFNVNRMPFSRLKESRVVESLKTSHGIILGPSPKHYHGQLAENLQPFVESWLPDTKVPVFGSCAGHQVLAVAMGADMLRGMEKQDGLCDTEIIDGQEKNLIFKGLGKHIKLMYSHWASVSIGDEKASGLIQLGRSLPNSDSTGCENAIIQVAGQSKWGFQGHPHESEDGRQLIHNFLVEIPRDKN